MNSKKPQGFVIIDRSIFDHPVLTKPLERYAFIWMIAEAAWMPCKKRVKGSVVHLQRGQMVLSRRLMAEKTGMSEQSVRTFLKLLENDQMINQQVTQLGTIVTICNYEKFQGFEQTTNPQINQQVTSFQPTANPQVTQPITKEPINQLTKVNNPPNPPGGDAPGFEEFWNAFPKTRRNGKGAAEKAYRKAIRKPGVTAEQLLKAIKSGIGVQKGFEPMPATWLNQERWRDSDGGAPVPSKSQHFQPVSTLTDRDMDAIGKRMAELFGSSEEKH